jgi:dienelactone hydrolase
MIVERTHYFSKPGGAASVLAIRRRACAVRRAMGLPAGRVFVRADGGAGRVPDVTWECAFPDREAHAADLAARAASPAFEAVRKEMGAAIDAFDRVIAVEDDAALPSGMRPVDLHGLPIVPREIRFRSDGRELVGYLYLPPGDGPFPCMIRNHGSGINQGTLDVSRPEGAALLMSWGIASFLPHRRGYGNSPGPGWREEANAEFGTPEYDAQVSARLDRESDDVLAALDCVAALPEIRTDRIGVMGSSFGGTNTLLAASKTDRFRCAIDFAGAAMNWDRTPKLRELMLAAASRVVMPLFLIQAENDYSIRPTKEIAASLAGNGRVVWSKIYPAYGALPWEGHLFESTAQHIWAPDIHRFLELHL